MRQAALVLPQKMPRLCPGTREGVLAGGIRHGKLVVLHLREVSFSNSGKELQKKEET